MGYRGDDASRPWADSRRQQPWRPSEGAPASAAGQRHAGGQGYESDGEYPSADGYGVYEQGPRPDGYGDYGGQHGYAGHGQPGGHDGGHGSGPYGGYDGYGDAGAFDGGRGYDGAGGFGDGNGYPEPGRHDRSPGYPGQDPSRDSGGYSIRGDYGREDSGGYDRPAGGFPDNDWYGDSRGGGFADTSIHVRPGIPDGYRPGDYDTGARPVGGAPEAPRPDPRDVGGGAARGFPPARAALPAPPSAEDGLMKTRQQRVLNDRQYDTAYPGYENVDDQPGVGGYGSGGYPAQGYDDYDDYANFTPDYDVPAPTTANPAYVEPAGTTGNPAYAGLEPEYDEPGEFDSGPGQNGTAVIDGYDDSFDDQGDPQGPPGKKGKTGKSGKPRRRRKKVAVLSLSALFLVAAVAAGYILLVKPTGEEATANAPLPSPGSTSAATAACVKQLGQYCHIEFRTDDPKPPTIRELFPPAVENTQDHISFQRIGTKIDKTCSNAVLGSSLSSALQSGKCTQLLRASYVAGSGSSEIMGTIGVANLSTTNQAHDAGKLVGGNDFLSPLATSSGVGANLGQSTGEMQASFKGHYLILTWAELANEATPTSSDNKKLIQFENDLVTVTANIALSQRMVSGQPAAGN
ncbi:MAG TPA: hypothetical protein VF060_10470 [Trebonia sp.]